MAQLVCKTKIAGTMSGPKAEQRQKCLEFIKRLMEYPGLPNGVDLVLVPEPENPHDPDAIRVEFEHKKGQRFHLGYIPNPDKHGVGERCGTATWLMANCLGGIMGKEEVWAEVEEVTGGKEGQNYGCNISIWRGG